MSDADLDAYLDEFDRRAQERRARRQNRRRRRHPGHARSGRVGASWLDRGPLTAAAVVLALATAVAMALLWPTGSIPRVRTSLPPSRSARVTGVREGRCNGGSPTQCRQMIVSVSHGQVAVDLGPVGAAPEISVGESVRVSLERVPALQGQAGGMVWQFVDVDRHDSLLWLAGVSVLLAVVVLRWRGLLAALGVVISLLIVTTFLIPALLAGEPALVVALVASLAVMFVTLVLTSGLGPQTLAAALGVGSTLLLGTLVALLATGAAHLNGHTDELSSYLSTVSPGLSLRGIVLAGMVIGALGVLADTGVTQASAVMSLRHANPDLGPGELYRASLRVGRDHLSATIHTLVLAYVGAALPLLLITRYGAIGLIDAVNTQDLAEPIVASLVGCLALICAVPVTTGLAAVLVARVPASELGDGHAHHH